MDEPKMYILINTSLKMRHGKVASQVAHAACEVVTYLIKHPTNTFLQWQNSSYTKIVLKSDEVTMEHLLDKYYKRSDSIWAIGIEDQGRTQIEPGSFTALAFCPLTAKDVPDELKTLKLY